MQIALTSAQKSSIIAVALLLSFSAGRYSVSQPKIKTVTDIKQNSAINTDKDEHKKVVIVTVKETTGKTTTTETITDNTETDTKKVVDTDSHTEQTITPQEIGKLNISALIGNDFSRGILVPTYGASVTKQALGPITVGAWGLTSGTVGISVGLNF